jgi:hypothetical protein
MERLSAPERTREELRALMNGDLGTAAGRGDLVRLALRLIVEEALEGEVADVLGRERYERGDGEKAGYRNGYRPGKVKTAESSEEASYVSGATIAVTGGKPIIWDRGRGDGRLSRASGTSRVKWVLPAIGGTR